MDLTLAHANKSLAGGSGIPASIKADSVSATNTDEGRPMANMKQSPFVPGPAADAHGFKTAAVCRRFKAPQFVVKSSSAVLYGNRPMPAHWVADPGTGTYPLHTPAAAWLSAAFYHHNSVNDEAIAGRIKSALDNFGMDGVWDALAKRGVQTKPLESVMGYAIPSMKRYPLVDNVSIKVAAAYFCKYANELGDVAGEFATNTLAAANEHNVDLDDEEREKLEAAAGHGKPLLQPTKVAMPYVMAAVALGEKELAGKVLKAAEAAEGGADPYKLAELLDKVGKRLNVKIAGTKEALTGLTPSRVEKIANKYVKAANGAWYEKAALSKVPAFALDAVFGTGPLVCLEKRAALLQTQGQAYYQLLADYGVNPVMVEDKPAKPVKTDWASLLKS